MNAQPSSDQVIGGWFQEDCGQPATHVFRQGDKRSPPSIKAHRHSCGELGAGRDDRDQIYLCARHCDSLALPLLFPTP